PRLPLSGLFLDENEAAVGDRVPHADVLVHPDRRRVLGPHEEADGRHALEQQAAEVAHAALRVAAAADRRVDPHLLELHRGGRPGRGLGLEEDRPALAPEPRAAVLDLRPRAPAEALGIARERIDPELLAMRRGAGRDEQLEVVLRRRSQRRLAGLRRLLEHVDRLARAVLAGRGQPVSSFGPEVAARVLLADHQPRPARAVDARERAASGARRYEIRADVAERLQPAVLGEPREAPEPAARDVL